MGRACWLPIGVLIMAMLLTMFVPEKPLEEPAPPMNWEPILRLVGMTVVFTLIILGSR